MAIIRRRPSFRRANRLANPRRGRSSPELLELYSRHGLTIPMMMIMAPMIVFGISTVGLPTRVMKRSLERIIILLHYVLYGGSPAVKARRMASLRTWKTARMKKHDEPDQQQQQQQQVPQDLRQEQNPAPAIISRITMPEHRGWQLWHDLAGCLMKNWRIFSTRNPAASRGFSVG